MNDTENKNVPAPEQVDTQADTPEQGLHRRDFVDAARGLSATGIKMVQQGFARPFAETGRHAEHLGPVDAYLGNTGTLSERQAGKDVLDTTESGALRVYAGLGRAAGRLSRPAGNRK